MDHPFVALLEIILTGFLRAGNVLDYLRERPLLFFMVVVTILGVIVLRIKIREKHTAHKG